MLKNVDRKHHFHIRKQTYVSALLLLLVYAGSIICTGFKKENIQSYRGNTTDSLYAGANACSTCHKAIYDSFINTAHYLTSRPGSARFIKGSFDSGFNHFSYNKFMDVVMEKTDNDFFQTVYINGEPTRTESMDIVVGSGNKGQTYLYWNDNLLYQLPVSYYSITHSWCNSPGYPAGMPKFTRLIPGRCLECHGSNASVEDAGNNINYIDKKSIIYGIDCERCHGPAADHVAFHNDHPEEKSAKYILKQLTMSRQQSLDVCGLCHSGIRKATKPVFSFKAGDRLEDFSKPNYNIDSAAALDVHGNQYGLLTSSKCFIKSSQMTCSSCHNVHQTEVNQPAMFSQRCISCHNTNSNVTCTVKPAAGMVLSQNCIDCHMPSLPSKAIFLQAGEASNSSADFVRTHRVAIYPESSKQVLKQFTKK